MSTTTLAAPAAAPDLRDLRNLVQSPSVLNQLAEALPKYYTPAQFALIVRTSINRTPKLMECTRESFMISLMNAAQMGIAPNGRDGHLIPRYNSRKGITECTFQPDYKGLVGLVRKNGAAKDVYAVLVRQGEHFEIRQGLRRDLLHTPDYYSSKPIVGVYAVIIYPDDSTSFEWMNRADVEAIRDRSDSWKAHVSKGYETPWKSDEGEMFKKTALKRLLKLADLSPDTGQRLAIDVETLEAVDEPDRPPKPVFAPLPPSEPMPALEDEPASGEPQAPAEPPAEAAPIVEPPQEPAKPVRVARRPQQPPQEAEPITPPTPEPPQQAPQQAPSRPGPVPGWEKVADPHDRLRALARGYSESTILKFLIRCNLADTTATTISEAPASKVMQVFSDPQDTLDQLESLTPKKPATTNE